VRHNSSVSTSDRLQTRQPSFNLWQGQWEYSMHHNIQIRYGAHPAYPTVKGFFCQG